MGLQWQSLIETQCWVLAYKWEGAVEHTFIWLPGWRMAFPNIFDVCTCSEQKKKDSSSLPQDSRERERTLCLLLHFRVGAVRASHWFIERFHYSLSSESRIELDGRTPSQRHSPMGLHKTYFAVLIRFQFYKQKLNASVTQTDQKVNLEIKRFNR